MSISYGLYLTSRLDGSLAIAVGIGSGSSSLKASAKNVSIGGKKSLVFDLQASRLSVQIFHRRVNSELNSLPKLQC